MAKKKGKDGHSGVSGKDGLYSPLYSSGDTNPLGDTETTQTMGKVGGPSGGKNIPDPTGLCHGRQGD